MVGSLNVRYLFPLFAMARSFTDGIKLELLINNCVLKTIVIQGTLL